MRSAPHSAAWARRAADGSETTIAPGSRTRAASRCSSPIGPAPTISTTSSRPMPHGAWPRSTHASGSTTDTAAASSGRSSAITLPCSDGRGRHEHVRREPAVEGDAERTRRPAEVDAPLPALPAAPAADVRRDEHRRALRDAGAVAGVGDRAGDLVAGNAHRPLGVRAVRARGDPQVGAADPARLDAHDDLAGARRRGRPLLDAQVAGAAVDERLHQTSTWSSAIGRLLLPRAVRGPHRVHGGAPVRRRDRRRAARRAPPSANARICAR